jgi:beta-glucosidase
LKPGERAAATITADPRLLADFDTDRRAWHVPEGRYEIALARSAEDFALHSGASITEKWIKP